jgi:hypothetical protein
MVSRGRMPPAAPVCLTQAINGTFRCASWLPRTSTAEFDGSATAPRKYARASEDMHDGHLWRVPLLVSAARGTVLASKTSRPGSGFHGN